MGKKIRMSCVAILDPDGVNREFKWALARTTELRSRHVGEKRVAERERRLAVLIQKVWRGFWASPRLPVARAPGGETGAACD